MKATPSEIEKYLRIISETPQQIAQAAKGLEEVRLQFKPDRKSWSANDILAHLRSCADLWTHSIYAMLADDEPVFSDINERKWAKVTRYDELSFAESLQVFSLQRENLVRVLKALPFESWERSAIIFERKHTVFTQTRRMAKHEAEHCEQILSLLRDNMG
jgi:DinB family protein